MAALALCPLGGEAMAAKNTERNAPSLIIPNGPLPAKLKKQIYSKPQKVRSIEASEVLGDDYFKPTKTLVGRRILEIRQNLSMLQNDVKRLLESLNRLGRHNEERAAQYFANIATINTQLQAGTTPGNPRLVQRLGMAETHLKSLAANVTHLNGHAVEAANKASEASFLLEETRAAYSLSGAVEEDHVSLAEVEDIINNTVIIIQRILNVVSDDLTRTTTYLSAERDNLRVLSLAVTNGDFYGRSLANRPFSAAPRYNAPPAAAIPSPAQAATEEFAPSAASGALSGPRPLAKIKFDRSDIEYQEPVYLAINEALRRYPNARFDLIAVTPTQGNAAQVAIESTKARRNAERVLRTLTQMGLSQDRIDLSYSENAQAAVNEVHLFVK